VVSAGVALADAGPEATRITVEGILDIGAFEPDVGELDGVERGELEDGVAAGSPGGEADCKLEQAAGDADLAGLVGGDLIEFEGGHG